MLNGHKQRIDTACIADVATRIAREIFATSKVESVVVLFNIFTVLDGIPSDDGYVIFIEVYDSAPMHDNGRTVAPNACLPWPDF